MTADESILLLLDVPEGTEIGIDWKYWQVGARFKGIKGIPSGIHFIYFSSVNRDFQPAPRTGFFHNFQSNEILVKQWTNLTESLDDRDISESDRQRYADNMEEIKSYLGPYPTENYKKWISLSNWLTPTVMDSLNPPNGRVLSVAQIISEGSNSSQRLQKRKEEESGQSQPQLDDHGLPQLNIVPGSQPLFTDIPPAAIIPPECVSSPGEVSRHSMDLSYTLSVTMNERPFLQDNVHNLLGELQYAFICFVLGNAMEGFEHWKKLLDLLCHCESAIEEHPKLFLDLLSLVYHQIQTIPEDFFTDIVTSNNFLVASLYSLFNNIVDVSETNDDNDNADLKTLMERSVGLKTFLKNRYRWNFDEEPEDELPVVVECTD